MEISIQQYTAAELGLRFDSGQCLWWLSGYAHVFKLLCVVVVLYPTSYGTISAVMRN